MPIRLAALLTLLLAAAAGPSPRGASAQIFTEALYHNYCTLGPFSACGSVTVQMERYVDTSFRLQVRMRNMQGSLWGYDDTGGSSMHMLRVGIPGWGYGDNAPDSNYGGAVYGQEGAVRTLSSGTSWFDQGYPLGIGRDFFHHVWGPLPYSLQGCSVRSGIIPDYLGAFSTCASEGDDGWILYQIRGNYSDIPLTAHDVNVSWRMGQTVEGATWGPDGIGGQMAGDIPCDPRDPSTCVQVATTSVPEPGTVLLLLPALLALGVTARRRRAAA